MIWQTKTNNNGTSHTFLWQRKPATTTTTKKRYENVFECFFFFYSPLTAVRITLAMRAKLMEQDAERGRERESERQKCFMILNIWRCSFHFHLVCPLLCAPCISANSSPNSYNFPSIFSIKHYMTYTLHIALRFDSKCCSILRYPNCWQQIKVIIFFFNVWMLLSQCGIAISVLFNCIAIDIRMIVSYTVETLPFAWTALNCPKIELWNCFTSIHQNENWLLNAKCLNTE